jgi:Tfp pilus assembly protein PilE
MGQQQLLLVILVTIIVGIATVVAINTFGSAADSANVDAVRQDLASIAASAQGYYMKPEMLGGGGRDFSDITFYDITFPGQVTGDAAATNENGDYALSAPGATSFVVTGTPSAGGSIVATVYADSVSMGSYTAPTP